jgi:deaminated glutathione amidase
VSAPLHASTRTTVAAIQVTATPRVEENLEIAGRLIAEAAARGAQLVALPEYFCLMGRRDGDKVAVKENFGSGPIQDFLAATAARARVWIVGGTLPLACEAPDKVRNASLVFDAAGNCVARYDKIHLFGFQTRTERYDESRTLEPGSAVVTLATPFGRVGLSICYDLRFPELYRAMGEVDLILIPSAFTETTGRAHWEILIRARAVENLCYVLAPAQGGRHENGRETYGNSMIVDPWGEVLSRLDKVPGVGLAEIDLARIAEVRASLPALTHRTLGR